jgi:hypothetical protein
MKEPILPFPEPQFEEIRVQGNYPKDKRGPYGRGHKNWWVDLPLWNSVEEARKHWPSCEFREKNPIIPLPPCPEGGYNFFETGSPE